MKTRFKIENIYYVTFRLKTSSDKWIIIHTEFKYIG